MERGVSFATELGSLPQYLPKSVFGNLDSPTTDSTLTHLQSELSYGES